MSIYIENMKMPEKGCYRIFILFSDGDVTNIDGKVIGKAISVPPHGKLGDLDALPGQMLRNLFEIEDEAEKKLGFDQTLRRGMQYGHAVCVDAVNDAPTIIPTDKKEQT